MLIKAEVLCDLVGHLFDYTMPRWPSLVRREPGELVVLCTSGVQISPSAFNIILNFEPRAKSYIKLMEI
jgi:hypothetical protein